MSMLTFAVLVCQAADWSPRGGRQKVLAAMWLIFSIIVSTVYRSNLKAMLIQPHLNLPFRNMGELVESDIDCLAIRGTILHNNIMMAEENSLMSRLHRILIAHNNVSKGVVDTIAGKHAFFTTSVGLTGVLHTTYSKTEGCTMYLTPDKYYGSKSLVLGYGTAFKLKHKIDAIIVNLREFGLLDYAYSKYTHYAKHCLSQNPKIVANAMRPLQMGDMYGVCLVYMSGVILSCLTFFIEFFVAWRKKGLVPCF